jgi:flavin-dependent dehydrogenase
MRRGEILPGSVRALLETLRLWPNFVDLDPVPITHILSSWGRSSIWVNDLSLHPFGCSWAIQRDAFDRMLRNESIAAGAVYLRASFRAASRHENEWVIHARKSTRIEYAVSNFLVDATGKVSAFARALGIAKRRLDKLVALSTVVHTSHKSFSLSHALSLETCPNGWWYSAPLPNSQLTFCFLTDPGEFSTCKSSRVEEWRRALSGSRFMKEQLRFCTPIKSVEITAAFSASLERSSGEGWSAVGDSASSVDPLCGAGVARALESGIECARCIRASMDNCIDALHGYEMRERRLFLNAETMRAFEYSRETQWPQHRFWAARRASNIDMTHTAGNYAG